MSHYFDPAPTAASRPARVPLVLPDLSVELITDRGVFSARGVDPGTMELLKLDAPNLTGDILDLGCGYGPIAIALATRHPSATVWALDVNARALELTSANAAALGLSNIRTVLAGDIPPGVTFRGIWSNPPIRIGKAAIHELLLTWLHRLSPDGAAHLVVHKYLGADSLAAWLVQQGFKVSRRGSKRGYRLLEVRP
jgi:16S rRNA (guanine1207-N2)-methyltransferase